MFDPQVPGCNSIFELVVRKLQTLGRLARQTHPELAGRLGRPEEIVLVVMTSPTNYTAITEFFKKNKNFGYSSIIFFSQPHLPLAVSLDENSSTTNPGRSSFKLLQNSTGSLIYAPNGNGGLFQYVISPNPDPRHSARW